MIDSTEEDELEFDNDVVEGKRAFASERSRPNDTDECNSEPSK